ncbi:hypothetical protein IGI04_036935 [Brassica rapa subsp. trilocularis]|uniref:Uncharacterized protein n=1 Tax=Brassica rapa subsp. trilocularis TaxID=1813537 RepID=A0ABQ7LIK2_BRACM|nr:hypothetical protein IGI04_036935 [Brassica rapa subsp. trilocularis]
MMKCLTQQHVTNKTTKEHLDALTAALMPPPADDHPKKAVVQMEKKTASGRKRGFIFLHEKSPPATIFAFVIRLCCPFMLLPVPCVTSHTAFVFFKVPRKLAQRVKKFVKRRCGKTLQPRFKNGGGCRQRGAHWCGKGVVFEENVARDEHRVRFWKLLAS